MSRDLLLFSAYDRVCAIPIEYIEEIMRPLPIEPILETPRFVLGVSMIRGVPAPVIDLGALLSGERLRGARRMVSIKETKDRRVGLVVTRVMGLHRGDNLSLHDFPPLLGSGQPDAIAALGRLDESLLSVLQVGSIVPEAVWERISEGSA